MRASGVLLPISSIPSKYGIGCFSAEAYEFVDRLKAAGQSYWQILPLGPVGYGDSPYQSFSTFAGNSYYIDLEKLIAQGWLTEEECNAVDLGSNDRYVDYEKEYFGRYKLLRKAFERSGIEKDEAFQNYLEEEKDWLPDYALFMALKDQNGGNSWDQWSKSLRNREKEVIEAKKAECREEILFYEFLQYEFTIQWKALKSYANENGIQIIGDIPIYVSYDSSDAWTARELFQFDEDGKPLAVAGCPPDAFTELGQLWGNPLYDWEYHKKTGYEWWLRRIGYCFSIYDVVRIDHFRGFDEYYTIPYGHVDARRGSWEKGPGIELFDMINAKYPDKEIIAEDLGFITESVRKLVKDSGYPGMKVLEFAFDARDESSSDYLPYKYDKNTVVYTGTHDNETLVQWFCESISPEEKRLVRDYLCDQETPDEQIYYPLVCLAMGSVSKLCIIPMQDWLGLGKEARMNYPSTLGDNWKWRLSADDFSDALVEKLYRTTKVYGRLGSQKKQEKSMVKDYVKAKFNKELKACTNEEIYSALLDMIKEKAGEKGENTGKKKVYYISAEFLIGKLLSNNLINLGLFDSVKKELEEAGKSIYEIEEIEPEPSLGNGGLGRLAACFLDSIATLGIPGDGIGINYHLGLFKQEFKNNLQNEQPNPWIEENSWLTDAGKKYQVQFRYHTVEAKLYDIDVTGYDNSCGKLHLFDIDSVDENLVEDGISFDKDDIAKNLTLFLYPDDSDEKGQLLRIYQQYFMVSAGAQMIIDECLAKGSNLHDLADYAAIQINDTHPTMVIPELIRLLMEHGICIDEAMEIVTKTCAYTNHTILAEALEKWPIHYLEQVVPQLLPIIRILDNQVRKQFKDPSVYIIDSQNRVHMAHIDIHFSHSVNGVAYLHTEILKNSELKPFYDLYPEKFNNKTNGITFRRWLLHCNEKLTGLIEDTIGDGFKKDAEELKKLSGYKDDPAFLEKLLAVKREKKKELAEDIKKTMGIDIDPDSIYDIQVKRLHEYKRQQLNALYVIHKYLEIKAGRRPETPITVIFGAKAAPAYTIAKDIIHLILCLSEIINNDPEVSPYLKVVMVENYNVSKAARLIPACDISEQISLASKEASGTGNMKFMLNGAVTLGTMDGANVEISELVGKDNIYIFGEDSDTVIKRYDDGSYVSKAYYEKDPMLKEAVDFIISGKMLEVGQKENLERLYNELLNKDWFMTFPDFADYVAVREKAYADYQDRTAWAKKMLVNIAQAGYFSSDRTISEYNRDIWNI